jgi:3-oxoacyl-[acyl-carrier protein] reductase
LEADGYPRSVNEPVEGTVSMDLGLKDKVALVPASSSGLGRAVAMAFAREGAKLAICSRSQESIDAVAGEIKNAHSTDVLALAADLSKKEDVENVLKQTLDTYGGIDVLVLNAGGPPPGTFDKLNDDQWYAAFELTMMSAVRLMRGAIPSMQEKGSGAIVSMSSSSIKQPIPNLLLSNAIRAGLQGALKTMSEELAGQNIRINTVIPGRIRTPRIVQLDKANADRQGKSQEEVTSQSEAAIPLGRYGEPEEFAEAVVFAASERASYMTGGVFQVDGGAVKSLW